MIFTVLGLLSAFIFIIGDIPYLLDTIKKTTQPQRITWGIVFLLNSIGFANQLASGAEDSLWLFGAAVLMTGLIFFASLWHGVGGKSKQDLVVLVIGLVGVALWAIFDDPVLSIVANMIAGIVALIPTFIKASKKPESETKITWLFGTISAVLAAFAVGEIDWQLLILPVNAAILQGFMVYLLYFKPQKENKTK